jgi:hypothetical protein
MSIALPSQKKNVRSESRGVAKLRARALQVLRDNDLGTSTKAAPDLYPNLFLWDSCFIAIGLSNINTERACQEVYSILKGQWTNGMLPHQIFSEDSVYYAGPKKWRSDLIKEAPEDIPTSGITQPPLLAEAVVCIGEKLTREERLAFYGRVLPALIKYHRWLYHERDPYDSGLVTLIHSNESGLDNTPYWLNLTRKAAPMRVRALRTIKQDDMLGYIRKDRKLANPEERLSAADFYTVHHLLRLLRRRKYKLHKLLAPEHGNIPLVNHIPLIQDVIFNAILIRANEHIRTIAGELGVTLPDELHASMEKSPHAFETLFANGNYWSRDFRTHNLIMEPTIGTFIALYAGTISQKHADMLASELQQKRFWMKYGIATVPADSRYFKPRRYWQGPVWVNTNWLVANGLDRYGYHALAKKLRRQTIELVSKYGMYEYFSPLDGKGAGTDNFSWTAALTIDMLSHTE